MAKSAAMVVVGGEPQAAGARLVSQQLQAGFVERNVKFLASCDLQYRYHFDDLCPVAPYRRRGWHQIT